MRRIYHYAAPGLVALLLGFRLGTVLLIRPAPTLDEAPHLKVVRQFGPGLPSLEQLRDYPSAAGPLFYVLFGNLGSLVRFDLTLLRIAVLALALGNVLLFVRIVRHLLPAANPMPAVALLATAPYFGALAGLFMTEHLALLLGLSALLCFLRFRDHDKPSDAVLALLFATLAIYARAYYAFLPAAFVIDRFLARRPGRSSPVSAVLWLLPILAFVPIAVLWRGLAPPSFQRFYHPGFRWQNACSLLVWAGIIFLPWVWRRLKPWHLLALAAVPVVLLAPLPGLGVTRTLLGLVPRPLAIIFACAVGSIGLLWLLRLAPLVVDREIRIAAIGALLLAAGLLISGPQVYERHLLPGVPLMLICVRPGTKPWLALVWAGLFQLPLAVAHILHLTV